MRIHGSSGVVAIAIAYVVPSSRAAIRSARSAQPATTGSGRARQICSVARVSAHPRTTASCSAFISSTDRQARAATGAAAPERATPPRARSRRDIFERPRARSVKVIGTSVTGTPAQQRAVRELDLERVAAAAHGRRSRAAASARRAPSLEAARQVANRQRAGPARVRAAAARERAPPRRPVGDRAAGHVARAERDAGAGVERGEQRAASAGRVVRAVGVHLHHGVRALRRARGRSPPGSAGPSPRRRARCSTDRSLARAARRARPCRRARRRRRRGCGRRRPSAARSPPITVATLRAPPCRSAGRSTSAAA